MTLKEEDKFKQRPYLITPPKALFYFALFVYLIFQVILLCVSVHSLYSDSDKGTTKRITQMEFALQEIKSTLNNVIAEKELLKTKCASGHRLYQRQRRIRRQVIELRETRHEVNKR